MLSNLQILRAIAALSVVVYHVLHTAKQYGLPADALMVLHDWGKNGVDVFFVISGFVMVYAQEYEMLFYLLFGVMIGVRRRVWGFGAMAASLALLAVSGFVGWIVLEFLLGMACALVFRHEWVERLARPIALAGAALLVAPLFIEARGPALLVSGLPAFLLVLGAAAMPQVRSPWWSFLGAASYSIYLVQVFMIPVCYKVASRFLRTAPGDVPALLAVVGTVAAGCALYRGVEKPVADALRRVRVAPARARFVVPAPSVLP